SPLNQQAYELAQKVLRRDQALRWNLLDSPHRLRIQTIDSFCASIVEQMPMSVNFVGQATISEDASKLYEKAAQATLKHIDEADLFGDALRHLLQHVEYDYYKLESALQQMLEKRDQWSHLFSQFSEADQFRQELEHNLALIIEHTLQEALELFPQRALESLRGILPTAASILAQENPVSPLCVLREWIDPLQGTLEELSIWRALTGMLLKQDGWRSLKGFNKNFGFTDKTLKQQIEPVLDVLSVHDELYDLLDQIRQLPPPRYSDEDWQVVSALLIALKLALANLNLVFREENQVDFSEITIQALNALGEETAPTDLMLAFDYRIKHILIDEFQDTSKAQTELLRKLTSGWESGDGRTLFVVGDPMQSIYRFRKAEVGLFMSAQHYGIGSVKLEPLHLVSNFRSHLSIVEWNNFVFSTVFPKHEDSALGAIPYSNSISINQDQNSINPIVHLIERDPEDKETDFAKQEADTIVQFLRQNNVFPNKSVAILVRSRSQLLHTTHLLRQYQIPFQATEIEALSEQQHIQDLLSLTRCILHPADKIHALNVLRAPWCGLTLSDLHGIAADPADLTLFELLEQHNALSTLPEEALTRAMRVLEILRGAYAQSGRGALRNIVEAAWHQLGGPITLREARHLDDIEMYFQLLEKVESAAAPMQELMLALEKLYAAPGTEANAIQIMTMHKSKGLEFDVVILPGLNRKSANDEKSLLSTDEVVAGQNTLLLLAPIEGKTAEKGDTLLQAFLKSREKRRAEFETQRLFYVACTRAKQQLHLFATVKLSKKEDTDYSYEAGALIKPLLTQLSGAVEIKKYRQETVSVQPLSDFVPKLVQLPLKALPKAQPHHAPSAVRTGFKLELANNYDSTIGEVVHRLLEHMAQRKQVLSTDEVKNLAPKLLSGFFHDPAQIEKATATIARHIEKTLLHPLARHAIEHAYHAELSLADENQISRIDLIYQDENGHFWVIDYKTSEMEGSPTQGWLLDRARGYATQLKRYKDILATLSDQPIHTVIFFTAYGEWVEVDVF
ncbi:MAG TPA: 3'-5' exonuclease, partial [Pseudomonadales bacterium]|nr:3'-5' exonuclease [Pseudomonadales bacterium]